MVSLTIARHTHDALDNGFVTHEMESGKMKINNSAGQQMKQGEPRESKRKQRRSGRERRKAVIGGIYAGVSTVCIITGTSYLIESREDDVMEWYV